MRSQISRPMMGTIDNTRHKVPTTQSSELRRTASLCEALLGLLKVDDGPNGIEVLLNELRVTS